MASNQTVSLKNSKLKRQVQEDLELKITSLNKHMRVVEKKTGLVPILEVFSAGGKSELNFLGFDKDY